ncbi:Chromosome III, complete sequence, related [Eimeria maxima]|uniref:Chromosome III, complete sequence, related n=1 Tax=Eimeria maxima TaxID=5804 RepID=U6M103_EIMMA|nr:Chromosome III, complete sequence, related [Eimeria maxima]CDJ56773.1 Chromosome III, complete sequence, related [Eimeria maxima]
MMHDRQQIDRKVTQAVQLGRVSRKKTANLLWLHKLQSAAHYQQAEKEALDEEGGPAPADTPEEQQRAAAAAQKKALKSIEERNVSATQILQHLGFCKEERKAPNKKITGTDDVFRQVLEESFALLPEDGPPRVNAAAAAGSKYGAAAAAIGRKRLSEKERARLQYAAFTDEEKLSLIDEKIKNITKEIDKQTQIRGIPKDLLLIQLRDHLEAAKQAYLEGKYIEETEKRMQQQQEQEKQQQQKEQQKLQQQEQQQEGTGDSKE